MHLTHIFSVACVVGSCHRTTEGRFHSVGVEHLSARCDHFFCDHSGIWNQMMIDKFTTDIKRTKTSICCLIVEYLLQYSIDY